MSVTLLVFFLENYEFSPHSVYPGQDLNRKRSQNADLCRDMYLSPATFPSLSIFKWQAWNLPDERDIEKYGLYFRLDSHNLNGANYKHKATTPRSEYAYIVDLVPFWSQKNYTLRRIIKLDTLDEFVKDNGSASYSQFQRLLYFICHQQEFFSLYTPWCSLVSRIPLSMWVLTSTSAF